MPERKVSQFDHGKSIHLADLFALCVYQEGPAENFFQESLTHAIRAANLGVNRALDLFRPHCRLSGLAGPVIRFA
jgi:hypothetical protein